MPLSGPSLFVRGLLVALLLAGQGACGGGGGGAAAGTPPAVDVSAVAAADPGSTLPAHWRQGVFAEIFVRAYQDSDGDGIGDLRGLISRLDYLKDLGVTGLWLMPVTASQDHDHGYAVADYRNIEADYGRLADLDALLAAAHARGIGVVIDYVMNHSASRHPVFLNSASAKSNAYRDWYLWQDSAPGGWDIFGSNPWRSGLTGAYFAAFDSSMPDWNLKKAEVRSFHQDNLRFWLNRGMDGFRFDAVGNLVENGPNGAAPGSGWESQPENHVIMKAAQDLVASYQQRYIVCEAPAFPLDFAAPGSCGGAFAFGLARDIIRAARYASPNGGNQDPATISRLASYWVGKPAGLASFLSNHDSFAGDRLWNQVGGDLAAYRLAAATHLLQGQSPFIYYGEEVGMANGSLSGDPKLRTPMSWSASNRGADGFSTASPFRSNAANVAAQNVVAQRGQAGSLFEFYKAVIALRTARPSLMQGSYVAPAASGAVMSFRRELALTGGGSERTLVAFNYGAGADSATVAGLPASARLRRLWPAGAADAVADAGGQAILALPAQSFAVYAVE